MESAARSWTLGEIASLLNGELRGPADLRVSRPVPADSDDPEGLAFAENESYLKKAEAAAVGALLVPRSMRATEKPCIAVDDPRMTFGMILGMTARPLAIEPGVHPTAIVHPEATVAPTASVGAYTVVERGAAIGERCRVHAFCYVGENCRLGNDVLMYPHVVLVQDVEVGAKTILHGGCVLGTDGFGFVRVSGRMMKVPQVGRIALGEDVEIGALTAVDRATAGETRIGRGTKIDNLVQIAHNVNLGEDGVMAGQVGIAGSTRIGDRFVMGGQAGVGDHVTIVDDVHLSGRASVYNDLKNPGQYVGNPAVPGLRGARSALIAQQLPEMLNRIRALEKKVAELEEGSK